jgi:WXG100 family type VII secretion target
VADSGRIVDTDAMQQAAIKINEHVNNLESIRTSTKKNIDYLATGFSAESATEYIDVMIAWDTQFDKITQALGKVVTALGGTARNSHHAEEDNKAKAKTLAGSVPNITLQV